MSTIRAERVEKSSWFSIGPLKRGRNSRETYVIGFDSEAEHGKPFLFQFAHPNGHVDLLDISRKKNAGLLAFIDYLYEHCTNRNTEYIVFGFNMQYEYTQLFRDIDRSFTTLPEFGVRMPKRGILIRALNDKRYTFTIEFENSKQVIRVIDAMAYFPMSLDAASKVVESGKKLPKPESFTRKERHTPEFEAYAKQDAILTQRLGEHIMDWHRRGDVNTCMSAPMLSSRIFRRQYLTETLPPMEMDLEQFGLYSYHGGKNGYYANRPQQLKHVYSYDIRSAYPEAMDALPCIEHGRWTFEEGYQPKIHAVYHVTYGTFNGCRFEPVYNADGTRIRSIGEMETWSTSYEIDQMVQRGELTIDECFRWEFKTDCKCDKRSPFRAFVRDFYTLKRDAKTAAERQYAKLNMNSLYGKLFQKVPLGRVGEFDLDSESYVDTAPDQDYDYRAGGLYHPPLASLVTGFVRAKIHHLEHKYNAIMTSTDGIFALLPPDPDDIGPELGKLDVAVGTLRIWRERLYIFTPSDKSKPKYALHGFRGGLELLKRVPLTLRTYHYRATEMVTLKRSRFLIDGATHEPGEFVERSFELRPMAASP